MTIRFIAGALAASIAFAPLAALAGPPPFPGAVREGAPPTAEDIAEAKAVADAVIAKAGVADLFDNATDGDVPTIRHRASGLECAFDDPATVNVVVYPGVRGEDVSCQSNVLDVIVSLYATRYPQKPTAEQVVASSSDAIRKRFKDVKPFEGTSLSMTTDADLPKPVTARFSARYDGKKIFTRSSAVVIGDWVVAQRVTAPFDEAMAADLVAEMGLIEATKQVMEGGKSEAPSPPLAPPPVPGPAVATPTT